VSRKEYPGVKYFLKVYKRDFERKTLAFDFNLRAVRRSVPPAGVKKNK